MNAKVMCILTLLTTVHCTDEDQSSELLKKLKMVVFEENNTAHQQEAKWDYFGKTGNKAPNEKPYPPFAFNDHDYSALTGFKFLSNKHNIRKSKFQFSFSLVDFWPTLINSSIVNSYLKLCGCVCVCG